MILKEKTNSDFTHPPQENHLENLKIPNLLSLATRKEFKTFR